MSLPLDASSTALCRTAAAPLRCGTVIASCGLHGLVLTIVLVCAQGSRSNLPLRVGWVASEDALPAAAHAPVQPAPEVLVEAVPLLEPSPIEVQVVPTPFVEPVLVDPAAELSEPRASGAGPARFATRIRVVAPREQEPEPTAVTALETPAPVAVAPAAGFVPARPDAAANRPPVYPRDARLRNEEGAVELSLRVLRDGSVAAVRILNSSGRARLDRAAVAAARAWRFTPATRDGTPEDSDFVQTVEFRLLGG